MTSTECSNEISAVGCLLRSDEMWEIVVGGLWEIVVGVVGHDLQNGRLLDPYVSLRPSRVDGKTTLQFVNDAIEWLVNNNSGANFLLFECCQLSGSSNSLIRINLSRRREITSNDFNGHTYQAGWVGISRYSWSTCQW